MGRLEVDQPARCRRTHFRRRIPIAQAVELRLQNFPHAIFETRSLGGEPLIEGWSDAVEIFEETPAMGLDEIAGLRRGVAAGLQDCQRIDPPFVRVDANAVATDLDETGNVLVHRIVELGEGLSQAHPGLRLGGPVPQQPNEATPRDALALSEAQAGQECACLAPARQKIDVVGAYRPHRPD